jgi:hypothetical protein
MAPSSSAAHRIRISAKLRRNKKITASALAGQPGGLAYEHPIYAELAKGTWKSAYNFALSDWWHAHVIHQIKRQKGKILVDATDNIGVVRVWVTIRDEQGKAIETAEATRGRGNWWKFTPQTEGGSILAEAWDLPENRSSLVLE